MCHWVGFAGRLVGSCQRLYPVEASKTSASANQGRNGSMQCQSQHLGKFVQDLAGEQSHKFQLVVSKIFYFHPYLGKIPILTNIFQMG